MESESLRVAWLWLATYVVHSSILLSAAWIGICLVRARNMALVTAIWKTAALLGPLTASVSMLTHYSPHTMTLRMGKPVRNNHIQSQLTEETGRAGEAMNVAVPRNSAAPARESVGPEKSDRRSAPVLTAAASGRTIRSSRTSATPKDQQAGHAVFQRNFQSVPQLILGLFGVTGIAFSLRILSRALCCARIWSRCTRLQAGVCRQTLDAVLQVAEVRREVTLYQSTCFEQPVAHGLMRWRIGIPTWTEERLNRDELYALMSHEVAHLVRRDTAGLWLWEILCAWLPVQPLNFVARHGWKHAAELLCDQWAVDHQARPLSLANCLTRVAETKLDRREPSTSMAAVGGKHALTHRIERLLSPRERTPRLRRRTLAGVAAAVAASLICVGPRVTWPEYRASAAESRDTPQSVELSSQSESLDRALSGLLRDVGLCSKRLNRSPSPELRGLGIKLRLRAESLKKRYDDFNAARNLNHLPPSPTKRS